MILESARLYFQELQQADYEDLCEILQDPEVMYAYEHAFDQQEVQQWLENQQRRYRTYGFGLWALRLKSSGVLVGQAGLTMQPYGDGEVLEIGYLLKKRYWRQGYATEAAIACKQYAFEVLQQDKVYSIIRDTNIASKRVAYRNGMQVVGQVVKHYYHMDMPHDVFCAFKCNESVK